MLRHPLRIVALVGRRAHDQRHQYRGNPRRAQLADRHRARAADDQVAVGQPARHVVDEGHDLDAGRAVVEVEQPGLRIGGAHLLVVRQTGLVGDDGTLGRRQPRQRPRQRLVEHLRPQAATDDQHPQRPGAARETLCRWRDGLDLGAHRVAGHEALRHRTRRLAVESEGDPVGELQQRAVRQQQPRVGVDEHQRALQPVRRQPAGEADIAAHAQHGIGLSSLQDAAAGDQRLQQLHAAAQRTERALAAQAGEVDRVHRQAGRRDQPVLHAMRRAQPAHLPAARLQLARNRQPRHDVAARSGGHDHETARGRLSAHGCLRRAGSGGFPCPPAAPRPAPRRSG